MRSSWITAPVDVLSTEPVSTAFASAILEPTALSCGCRLRRGCGCRAVTDDHQIPGPHFARDHLRRRTIGHTQHHLPWLWLLLGGHDINDAGPLHSPLWLN